jgi:hypothetical protein
MGLVILEELTPMMHDILHDQIEPNKIDSEVSGQVRLQKSRDKKKLNLNAEQNTLIKNAQSDGYRDFDITLTYTLLRNLKCVDIAAPTQGWGASQMPGNGETTLGDDVERIRLIRNRIWGHAAVVALPETEFLDLWSIISDICSRMQALLKTGKNYVQSLKDAEVRAIDEKMEKIKTLDGKCVHIKIHNIC